MKGHFLAVPDSGELRVFPQRLHHETPGWVKTGSIFHVRIRAGASNSPPLTQSELAENLLESARNYHQRHVWQCELMLVMPDHLHALIAFPPHTTMAKTIGAWKRYGARNLGIIWQENFFDHRIRNDHEFTEKIAYILRNPVAKELCALESDWPWSWRP